MACDFVRCTKHCLAPHVELSTFSTAPSGRSAAASLAASLDHFLLGVSQPQLLLLSLTMAPNQAGAASLGMASENFGYSRVRLRRVKKLQFGVVNPHELVRVNGYRWHKSLVVVDSIILTRSIIL
jgi:hypothetical protein